MGKKKINVYALTLAVFILFLIGYTLWAFVHQGIEIRKYKKEVAKLQKEIQTESEDMKKLKEEKVNYKKPEYIEKIARERLKMVKPGEVIYIDVNKKKEM